MDRRVFLRGLAAAGCSVAAHPLMTSVTLAQGRGLGDHRLVVVILRGAMDGLDVVQPVGDAEYAAWRPGLAAVPGARALAGQFALHPALGGLGALWDNGELGFVHATSTPYRNKRSHFDGQDLLEAGTGMDVPAGAVRDGWLNRMLQAVPGLSAETAYAVGREALPLLAGRGPALSWAPEVKLTLSAQSQLLLDHIYHEDELFRDTGAEAMALSAEMAGDRMDAAMAVPSAREREASPDKPIPDIDRLVDFAAGRLVGETRIAAFSLAGWDTHRAQGKAIGKPLSRLQRIVLRLQDRLGPEVWGRTSLLAMTEFGRTVRENGAGGTDHGTAGAMLVAGGAVRGGQVLGRWPGLAEADLFDRRDLMPTSDARAWAAWAMRGLYGLDRDVLERSVFPGLDMGDEPGLIL